jgi:hypothetical protein
VHKAFEATKQNNKNFSLVHEGGDGEVLIGLENDSPKCVPPTGLCSYKMAVRIRDNENKVVYSANTTASANAEQCSNLCERAINSGVVKVVETAVNVLKGGEAVDGSAPEPSSSTAEADAGSDTGTAVSSNAAGPKPPAKKGAAKATKVEPPPKPEPSICAVAHGPHLATDEAEKRAAQVEVLKRISVLDQDEYDCLRKAYLDRL